MKKMNEKKLPEFNSEMEEGKSAAQSAVEEIVEQKQKASKQIEEARIQELAYFNHLKYPENSELDNWYLAIEQYKQEH